MPKTDMTVEEILSARGEGRKQVSIVVDTSIAACWCLPDEYSEVANNALAVIMRNGMTVPSLFRYELHNVLLVNERRKRIDPRQSEQGLMLIGRLPTSYDADFDGPRLMVIAREAGLSIDDAA